MTPDWLAPDALALAGLRLSSHQQAFAAPLLAGLAADASPQLAAQELFAAEVVVLAHDGAEPAADPGPRLIYANRAALRLWQRSWARSCGEASAARPASSGAAKACW